MKLYLLEDIENNKTIKVLREDEILDFCKENNMIKDSLMRTLENYPNKMRRRKAYNGYKLVELANSNNMALYSSVEDIEEEEIKPKIKDSDYKNIGKKEIDYEKGKITANKILNIREEEISSDILLREFNLDPKEWKVEKFTSSVWNSNKYNEDTEEFETLYAVKVWFKQRDTLDFNIKELKEIIDKDYSTDIKISTQIEEVEKYDKDTLLINIADLHLNKVGINYNTDIAVKRYFKAFNYIVENSASENCIMIVGEDFFNIDNLNKATTKGTPQDTEYSFYDMFEVGLEIMIQSISYLSEIFKNVKVILVQGNHDNLASYVLARALGVKFENVYNVDIDYSVLKRKYIMIGNSLIGLGHLDTELKQTKTYLMQNEVKEHYGKSKFNYFISGHFHNYSVEEVGGVQYIRLPSLSGADKWHNDMGFITSQKGAIGLEFSKDRGLVNKIFYNVLEED